MKAQNSICEQTSEITISGRPFDIQKQLYAIWLVPEAKVFGTLRSMIDALAERCGTIRFLPHATLCSGEWTGDIDELKANVASVAKQIYSLAVVTAGLDQTDAEFQFFYIALPHDYFEVAVRCAREGFPSARLPLVGPHVSLIYSREFERIDRHVLRSELAAVVPASIQFESLALVFPKDNNWYDIQTGASFIARHSSHNN